MASISEVKIVLVGKTGSGKSAAGNKILGKDAFKEDFSPNAVTRHCAKEETTMENRQISLTDTPGLFDTSISNKELTSEIRKCVEMSTPGPHVFLLVIRVERFSEEDKTTVKWIQDNFGEDAAQYTIILFTHVDLLNGKSLEEFIKESAEIQALIQKCGGRYHAFNNQDKNDQTQVKVLLQKIDEMVKINGKKYYTNEIYKRAQRRILMLTIKDIGKCVGAFAICTACAVGVAHLVGAEHAADAAHASATNSAQLSITAAARTGVAGAKAAAHAVAAGAAAAAAAGAASVAAAAHAVATSAAAAAAEHAVATGAAAAAAERAGAAAERAGAAAAAAAAHAAGVAAGGMP